jgi:hypothetical protein
MFGAPAASSEAHPVAPAPLPPAAGPPIGGSATQAFSIPPSTPVVLPQGPSEYTRMMSAPPASIPQAPQIPAAPLPAAPQLPAKAPPSSRLRTGILMLLAFLAGGLLVFLFLRR